MRYGICFRCGMCFCCWGFVEFWIIDSFIVVVFIMERIG